MSPTRHARHHKRAFDPLVFWVSALLTLLFVAWSVFLPASMERVVGFVFDWTTRGWGWLYLLTVFALVIASFVLMVTDFGSIKLGLPHDRPEFSNLSWFAMLFGSAIAARIVFWGPAEPASHYVSPPPFFGGDPKTPLAGRRAPLPHRHVLPQERQSGCPSAFHVRLGQGGS